MKRVIPVLAALSALLVFASQAAVSAGTTIDISTQTNVLHGVGPTIWDMGNYSGCNVSGFSPLYDVSYNGNTDAFDGGYVLGFDGNTTGFYDPDNMGTLSHGNFKLGPEKIAGLSVSMTLRAIKGSPTLRDLITLRNGTNSKVTTKAWIDTDLGSDSSTVTQATSSGDSVLSGKDRWVISTDSATAPFGDPPVTQVLYGIGASVKTTDVLDDPGGGKGTQGCMDVTMKLTVPAKSTRYLMLFAQVHGNNKLGPAKTDVKMFNARGLSSTLLAGISEQNRLKILNWDVG